MQCPVLAHPGRFQTPTACCYSGPMPCAVLTNGVICTAGTDAGTKRDLAVRTDVRHDWYQA
eukprot:3941964-Rhodomonas_salina.3